MPVTPALTAELAILTATLDDPHVDIADTIQALAATAALAISSYQGLTVTTTADDGGQIHFTVMTHDATGPAATSIRLPRSATPPTSGNPDQPTAPSSALILYAGAPGAFVDLAADLSWLTGAELDTVILDQDLTPPDPHPTGSHWSGISIINQAIGVLLARGHLPEQAQLQLDDWATRTGGTRLGAAQHLLADLDRQQQTHVRRQ